MSEALDQDRLHSLGDHVGAVNREVRVLDYHTKRDIDAIEIKLVAQVPVSGGLTLNLTDLWSWLLICRSSPTGHSYGGQLTGWAVTP